MPTLEQYKKRLQGKQKAIKEQRRRAADLNNDLAFELADGHQEVQVLTRTAIDDMAGEWRDAYADDKRKGTIALWIVYHCGETQFLAVDPYGCPQRIA